MLTDFFVALILAASTVAIPSLDVTPLARRGGPQTNVAQTHLNFSTWAGAIYTGYPAGTFRQVNGEFIIPAVSLPMGEDSTANYSASAWVGVDGVGNCSARFQTGMNFNVQDSIDTYSAWFQWWPSPPIYVPSVNISFAAGDVVMLSVLVVLPSLSTTPPDGSATRGIGIVQNISNNQTFVQDIESTYPLCMQDTEWIFEDHAADARASLLSKWGAFQFYNTLALATTKKPIFWGNKATPADIWRDGQYITQTSFAGSWNNITVGYIG